MSERKYVEVALATGELEDDLRKLEKVLDQAKSSMEKSAKSMVSALADLGEGIHVNVVEPVEQLSSVSDKLASSMSAITSVTGAAQDVIGAYGEMVKATMPETDELENTMKKSADTTEKTNGVLQAVGTAAQAAAPGIQGLGATMNTAFGVVGLIATGISALITLFSSLAGESSATAKQIEEDTETITSANEEIRDATSEATIEYDRAAISADIQKEKMIELVNEYMMLKFFGEQNIDTQNRMRNITKTLTAEYESLGQYVNETTGQFEVNGGIIRQCIKSQEAYNKAMAATDYKTEVNQQYLDALTQQQLLEKQIGDNLAEKEAKQREINTLSDETSAIYAEMDLARAQANNGVEGAAQRYQELSKQYSDNLEVISALESENGALTSSNEELKKSQEDIEKQVADLEEQQIAAAEIEAELNTEALQGYADRLDSIGELGKVHDAYTETEIENIETLLASQNNLSEAERQKLEATVQRYDAENAMMEAQIEATKESYNTISSLQAQELEQRILNGEELSELEEAQLERFREIQDERVSIATNGNERINLEDQISLEKRTANMEHNNEVLKGFDNNMDHLRKVEDETLQAYLNSIDIYSEEGMAIVAQLANGISATGEMSDEVKDFLATWAESMATSTGEVGGAVEDAAGDVGSTMGEEMNPQEASDTTKTYFDAAINMVTVKGAELKNKMKDVMQDAMDAADRKASPGNWRSIGQSLMSGIIGGVRSKKSELVRTIVQSIVDGVNAGKKKAEINSPSRLFAREIGLPISEGMALGVTQGAGMLERALDDTIRNTALGVDPVVFRDISSAFAGAAAGTGSRTVNSNITFQVNGDITAVQRRRIVQDVRRELGRLVN